MRKQGQVARGQDVEELRDVDRGRESLSQIRNTLKTSSACGVPKMVISQSPGLYLTEKLGVNF